MAQVNEGNVALEDKEIGKSEILDIISEDTEVEGEESSESEKGKRKESGELPKESEKEDEEGKEEKEPEIKLEYFEDEEQPSYNEEEIEIIAPARRQEILKKYPTLFKEFPHLEKAYFRDQKYNELFGTPQDAEQVIETAKSFNEFSDQLLKGDTKSILGAVKQENPEAFGKIIDNYLGVLRDVDERAFFHVYGNAIKSTVALMAQEAQRLGNEDLLGAARLLHQFVTGTTEWQGMQPYNREKPQGEVQQESKLNQERVQFFQERFETTQSDLQGRVDGVLKNTIDQNMDPKGLMTAYVKKVAVQEAFQNTQKLIRADPQFVRLLDRLWERAAEEKFSKSSVEKIRSAYLSRAKSLLPSQIKKSRVDALRGLGKRVREDNNSDVIEYVNKASNNNNSREASPPRTIRGSNRKENPSRGKSTLEFLNED